MQEEWRTVPDFPKFQVSTLGRVRRIAFVSARGHSLPEKIVKPSKGFYIWVTSQTNLTVGSLMLRAFDRLPSKDEVARHLDDDISHNVISNLAWGTQKQNAEDAKRNKRIGHGSPAALKASEKLRGHVTTETTRKLIGDALRGKKHTAEARANMSQGHLGKPLPQSTRDKMSKSRKGRKLSPETKAKISRAHKGRIHTPEARRNMGRRKKL